MRFALFILFLVTSLYPKLFVYEVQDRDSNSIGMVFMEAKTDTTISILIHIKKKDSEMDDSTCILLNKKGDLLRLKGHREIRLKGGVNIPTKYTIVRKDKKYVVLKEESGTAPPIVSFKDPKNPPVPILYALFYLPYIRKGKLKKKLYLFIPPVTQVYEGTVKKGKKVKLSGLKEKVQIYKMQYDKRNFDLYIRKDGVLLKLIDREQNVTYSLKSEE